MYVEKNINKIRLLSVNVNSIEHEDKIEKLEKLIEKYNPDIIFFQEAKLTKENTTHDPLKPYFRNYSIYYNCYPTKEITKQYKDKKTKQTKQKHPELSTEEVVEHVEQLAKRKLKPKGGLVTMIKANLNAFTTETYLSEDHRIIITTIKLKPRENLDFYNIYAPAEGPTQNDPFFDQIDKTIQQREQKSLQENIKTITILGGDMNALINRNLDFCSISCPKNTRAKFKGYERLIKNRNLTDAFRFLHPNEKKFTFIKRNKNPLQNSYFYYKSRIDTILTSTELQPNISNCDIDDTTISDHKAIYAELSLENSHIPSFHNPPEQNFLPRYKTRDIDDLVKLLENNIVLSEATKRALNGITTLEEQSYATLINLEKLSENLTRDITIGCNNCIPKTKPPDKKHQNAFIRDPEINSLGRLKKKIEKLQEKPNAEKEPRILTEVNDTLKTPQYKFITNLKTARKKISQKRTYVIKRLKKINAIQNQKKLLEIAEKDPKLFNKRIKNEYHSETQMTLLQNEAGEHTMNPIHKTEIATNFTQKLFSSKIHPRPFENSPMEQIPLLLNPQDTNLSFPITMEELDETIRSMQKFKAPGPDNIPIEILNALPKDAKDALLTLLNKSLRLKKIPESWKKCNMTYLPKKGDLTKMENYRAISLLNCQYKIYTQILNTRLKKFLEENKYFSKSQNGFRKGKTPISCAKALIAAIEDAKQFTKEIHVLYIDIKKAFDSVEHWAIEHALRRYNVDPCFIEIIRNLFVGITTKINLPFGTSPEIDVSIGVRQGDTISPLLFITFLNPLLEHLETKPGYRMENTEQNLSVLACADDMALIASTNQQLQNLTDITQDYFKFYGIEMNPSKSAYTFKNPKTETNPNIILDKSDQNSYATFLEQNESYRYLGYNINLNLDWNLQQKMITTNYLKGLANIGRRKMPTHYTIRFINSVLNPILQYSMNCIYFGKKPLLNLDTEVKKIAKHSIPEPTNAPNEILQMHRKNGGRGLTLPSSLQDPTMVRSILNQTLNKEQTIDQIDKLTLLSRIKSSPILQIQHGTLDYNPSLTTTPTKPTYGRDMIHNLIGILAKYKLAIHTRNSRNKIANYIPYKLESTHDFLVKNKLDTLDKLTISNSGKYSLKTYENLLRIPNAVISKITYNKLKSHLTPNGTLINTEPQKEIFGDSILPKPIDYLGNTNLETDRNIDCKFFHNRFLRQKEYEIWTWTDGSVKTENGETVATYATCFHHTQQRGTIHITGHSDYKDTISYVELKAIEVALTIAPKIKNLRIFTDSLTSKISIENFNSWTSKQKQNCENREILRRILNLINERTHTYQAKTHFTYVPSHIEQKLQDEDKTPKVKESLRELEETLNQNKKAVKIAIQGNELADRLANEARKEIPPEKPKIPLGTDEFFVTDNTGTYVNNPVKYILDKQQQKIVNAFEKKKFQDTHCRINIIESNKIMTKKPETHGKTQNFATKVRSNCLPTYSILFKRVEHKKPEEKHPNLLYIKSKDCIICSQLYKAHENKDNNEHFLLHCPYLKHERKSLHKQLTELIKANCPSINSLPCWFANLQTKGNVKPSNAENIEPIAKLLTEIELFPKHLGAQGYIPTALTDLITIEWNSNRALVKNPKELVEILTSIFWEKVREMWKFRCKTIKNIEKLNKGVNKKKGKRALPDNQPKTNSTNKKNFTTKTTTTTYTCTTTTITTDETVPAKKKRNKRKKISKNTKPNGKKQKGKNADNEKDNNYVNNITNNPTTNKKKRKTINCTTPSANNDEQIPPTKITKQQETSLHQTFRKDDKGVT